MIGSLMFFNRKVSDLSLP